MYISGAFLFLFSSPVYSCLAMEILAADSICLDDFRFTVIKFQWTCLAFLTCTMSSTFLSYVFTMPPYLSPSPLNQFASSCNHATHLPQRLHTAQCMHYTPRKIRNYYPKSPSCGITPYDLLSGYMISEVVDKGKALSIPYPPLLLLTY